MNQTAVVMMAGHVVTEPRPGKTRSGHEFTRVRVGVTPRRPDRETGEWRDVGSSYFTVVCWRRMAESASASLRKGDPVIVWGKLKSRAWVDSDGVKHQSVEIEADTICHDASMGWTHFLRGRSVGAWADDQARRDLAAAEDVDAFPDGAGDPVGPGLDPDAFTASGDPGGSVTADGTAGAEGDSFGDGKPFQSGAAGDDEVLAAATAEPVAALVAEAAPF